ncbi:MAG: sigma 54-interacting transcriptional regulator [Sandaracinaceae bacterium]
MGPSVVLYLIAEVVSGSAAMRSATLDAGGIALCAVALGLAAIPFWVLREQRDQRGTRRVASLGVAAGAALMRWTLPSLSSLTLDLAAVVALPVVGGLALLLALDTPDAPGALAKRDRAVRIGAGLTVLVSVVAGALAVGPAPWAFGEPWLVPARWAHVAPVAASTLVFVAAVMRGARRRMGSTPEALAAGGLAHLGSWLALVLVGIIAGLTLSRTLPISSTLVRALAGAASLCLVVGHVAMIGARRQVHAGRHTRRLLAGAIAVGAAAGLAAWATPQLPSHPTSLAVAAAFLVVATALLDRLLCALADRFLAPFSRRLLEGTEEALTAALRATTFEELAEAVLPPLRRASGDLDAAPLLLAFDPPREVRVDAAGMAHVADRPLSTALLERLRERPGDVIVAGPVLAQVVRRADLRPLADALNTMEAFCVVPLGLDEEPEGALVVPQGRRRSALTLEEIAALETLGRNLAGQLALMSAGERGRRRTRDAVVERDRLEDALDTTRDELERLREDTHNLSAGGSTERFREPAIAYSPTMRALTARIEQLGAVDAPVLLVGEEGSELERVAYLVHAGGGRRDGPFVVADCAAVRPERAEAALFGEASGQPGWLRLASTGTCVLLDVPALSPASQARLAEAIATRRATFADGSGGYEMSARVVATSRIDLPPLVAQAEFDAELHRRLEPLALEVPPLRQRVEDLPSLVLLALDRVCRVTGRPVMGLEPDALEALKEHDWPGNLRELRSVIERAVASADGPAVRLVDLPPLAPAAPFDPWSGTYAEIETRLLRKALERAGGNKSEAARELGLKRTTFLDKLKRHGLSETRKSAAAN